MLVDTLNHAQPRKLVQPYPFTLGEVSTELFEVIATSDSRASIRILLGVIIGLYGVAGGGWFVLQLLSNWTLPTQYSRFIVMAPLGLIAVLWAFAPTFAHPCQQWVLAVNRRTRRVDLYRSDTATRVLQATFGFDECRCRVVPVAITFLVIWSVPFVDRHYLVELATPSFSFALACTSTEQSALQEALRLPPELLRSLTVETKPVDVIGSRRVV